MSRYKLLPALVKTYKDWRANNKRYSRVYCPLCHHDLNGDNNSFVSDTNKGVLYRCARCGCESLWYFDDIVPWIARHQRLTNKMWPTTLKEKE